MIKIIQGSAVTQIMLGGLTINIIRQLQVSHDFYVPKIMRVGWH